MSRSPDRRSSLERGSPETKPRSCGNQPAHESLFNRRLRVLSPAVRISDPTSSATAEQIVASEPLKANMRAGRRLAGLREAAGRVCVAPSCSLPRGKTQGKIFSRLALHQKMASNQSLVCDLPVESRARQGNSSVGIAHRMLVVEKARLVLT